MDNLTLGWILILISSCVSAVYLYVTRNYSYWIKKDVKQVSPTFPFGNIGPCLTGQKNPIKLVAEIYQKGEGESMIGFYSFDKPHLLLRDPELIKHVLVRDFNNFSNKILIGDDTDPFGAKSLFLVKNPPWKHIRSKLTPIFTSGKLKNMFRLMLEICQDFHDHLDRLDIDDKVGKPVEVKELLGKFMTDIIGTTAFGMKLNSLTNEDAEFRRRGRKMFRAGFRRYIELLSIFFLPALRPLTKAKFFDKEGTDFLRQSFWDVINERVQTGIKRPDLIELLIELKKSQENDSSDNYKLEGDDLVAQAAIFFTGGFETTATTTSFVLYELVNHPEIQRRLRDEILEGIERHKGITYDMITTLPYLTMVIQEAQRMYPILPWLDRVPENDYTFSGTNVTIKKGFPIILPMGALQRDPKYFPNPEKFDPERFSEINKTKITPFSYFPFGEGPRQCIGERLGLIQTKLAVVSFLSKYELTFCKETLNPLKLEDYHVLNQVKGNLFLNLRKIST